jgi:alkylation response protein AidB-like acyl-CoA dehydrogenase
VEGYGSRSNFEKTPISAQVVGWMQALMRKVVPYAQTRVRFRGPTIDIPNNEY